MKNQRLSYDKPSGSTLWPTDLTQARLIQEVLCNNVRIQPLDWVPRTLVAIDAAYAKDKAIAAACLYTWPALNHIEDATAVIKCDFPYVTGFLTFREGPAVMKAIEKLRKKPGMLLCDGQGVAHPRGMGIATHLGALLGIPSVGCAKSRLIGEFKEPAAAKGSTSKLLFRNNMIGAVVRTRNGVRPVFVSPGHLTDIPGSIEVVMHCVSKFRLPEPIRRAHNLADGRKNML